MTAMMKSVPSQDILEAFLLEIELLEKNFNFFDTRDNYNYFKCNIVRSYRYSTSSVHL